MSDATNAKSVDPVEIANFSAMADEWWDETGKFKPLHKFNPIRIGYVRDQILSHFGRQTDDTVTKLKPFKGLRFLDIGCGGGLLSEPMARLGADMVSADASEKNIQIAGIHAEKMGLNIDYRHTSAENLAEAGEKFDVILNMEVIVLARSSKPNVLVTRRSAANELERLVVRFISCHRTVYLWSEHNHRNS